MTTRNVTYHYNTPKKKKGKKRRKTRTQSPAGYGTVFKKTRIKLSHDSNRILATLRATFPAPSSKLCQKWLHHWRGTLHLRAAVHLPCQRTPKCLGTNKTGSNIASKHAHKHEAWPPRVKERLREREREGVPSRFKRIWFYFWWRKQRGRLGYKRIAWYRTKCLLQTYSHLSTIEKLSVKWLLLETYDVISYGSGWRKDVVNQCLEFGFWRDRCMIMDDSGHRVTHCVHDCQELSVASSLQPSVASDLSELLPNVHMLYTCTLGNKV